MGQAGITPLVMIGKQKARIPNKYVREAIGEFFGTLILCFMCIGAAGQYHVKNHSGYETMLMPVLGIILGIMTATIINGGISGAHINPAVSIALAVAGDMSWISVPVYIISQFLGSIVGAFLGWSLVHPIIGLTYNTTATPWKDDMTFPEFDMENGFGIGGIFGPFRHNITVANGLCTELVLTCILMITILAAGDRQSSFKFPKYMFALIFPLAIAGFAFCFDLPSATLLNPARDLGPRITAWALGWKAEYIFKSPDPEGNLQHWWLVSLFGPTIGGVLGSLIFSFIIGPNMNTDHLDEESGPASQPRSKDDLTLKAEGTDWRSTVFVAKPQADNPQQPNYQNNNETGYQPPHHLPQGSGGGYNNSGYNNSGFNSNNRGGY